MHMYGDSDRFPLKSCIVWVGSIVTAVGLDVFCFVT